MLVARSGNNDYFFFFMKVVILGLRKKWSVISSLVIKYYGCLFDLCAKFPSSFPDNIKKRSWQPTQLKFVPLTFPRFG